MNTFLGVNMSNKKIKHKEFNSIPSIREYFENIDKSSQHDILSSITADDIINTDNVLNIIMTAKKEKLLAKMHPYKITEPKSKNGRWQTYYKDASGERKR